MSLKHDLEFWFYRLGIDDSKWLAKEIYAYLMAEYEVVPKEKT